MSGGDDVPGAGWTVSVNQQMQSLLIREEEKARSTNRSVTEVRYSAMLRSHIGRAFARAEEGSLWRQDATPSFKLRRLEGAVKDELLRFGVRRDLVTRWSLFNSNIFGPTVDVTTSPLIVTLNCAPVDDGGSGACGAGGWTPAYLRAIVETLSEHGLWSEGLTPMIAEFRAVCPVLLALSDAQVPITASATSSIIDKAHLCGAGFQCGDYPEQATTSEDRALHARFLGTTHAAASRSWVRLHHSRASASAARSEYSASQEQQRMSAAECGRMEPRVGAEGWTVELGAFHPGYDNYSRGRFIVDNLASWATAAALVSEYGQELGGRPAHEACEFAAAKQACFLTDVVPMLVPLVVKRLCESGFGKRLKGGSHASLVAAFLGIPPRLENLGLGGLDCRPLHKNWGCELREVGGGDLLDRLESTAADGALRELCAGNGAVGLRLGRPVSPARLIAMVERLLGGVASEPPTPSGWPVLEGEPRIHLLGSPGSGGEYIQAAGGETSEVGPTTQERWVAEPSETCAVTDWHVDEPWLPQPARYTVLYAAEHEGKIGTAIAHTAGEAWCALPAVDQTLLLEQARFLPPPWLVDEDQDGSSHALWRETECGAAAYVCADSVAQVGDLDRETSVAAAWRITKALTTPEKIAIWNWQEHDVLILDNHSSLHARTPYDAATQKRLLYRIRVQERQTEKQ